jgi:hypothetical protein
LIPGIQDKGVPSVSFSALSVNDPSGSSSHTEAISSKSLSAICTEDLKYSASYVDLHRSEAYLSVPQILQILKLKDYLIDGKRWEKHVPGARREFQPPLTWAAITGQIQIIRYIVREGHDVNDRGADTTALYEAARSGYATVVKHLLDTGADISRDETILCRCAGLGYKEIVQHLLDAGADPNSSRLTDVDLGKIRITALCYAAIFGRNETIELLLDRCANLTRSTEYVYENGLSRYCSASCVCCQHPLFYAVTQGYASVI